MRLLQAFLELLRSQKASMGSQNQAQITFSYKNAEMGFRDSQEAVCLEEELILVFYKGHKFILC